MWCTRWFLPLLLLPLPTAPPFFLLLFLVSLTIHAKPCFYCIVLLTTLFISSCYWQPFPIDSPLTVPWADNITTFAEALNATIRPSYTKPLPTVMHVVDRCWCDFSVGGFFEPFNVSHWEDVSITRLGQSLGRQQQLEDDARAQEELDDRNRTAQEQRSAVALVPATSATPALGFWSRLKQLTEKSPDSSSLSSADQELSLMPSTADIPQSTDAILAEPTSTNAQFQATPTSDSRFSFLRQEYDLRPYGLGMVVDLRWS
ncbi:hypothetical protein BJ912DRAFT_1018482 [Pholiota molesta]|nr:hypothetical protein BJ912DRAFT_1018482 [Pholiota molesta]